MTKLFKYLKGVIWEIILIVIFLVAQAYLQLMLPEKTGAISNIIQDTSLTTSASRVAKILPEAGWMFLISFSVLILAIFISFLSSRIASTFGKKTREAIFKKVNGLSLAEYDQFGTSSLITRTTNDVQQIQQVILMGLRILISSPVTIAIAIGKVLKLDASLSLVLAVSIPVIIIVLFLIGMKALPLFNVIQNKIDKTTKVLRESLTGVRVIRAFNQEEKEKARFDEANKDLTNTTVKVGRTMSFLMPTVTIVMNLTYISVMIVGFLSLKGTYNIPTDINIADSDALQKFIGGLLSGKISNIVVVTSYVMQVMFSFLMFVMIFIMVPRASACAKRINAVLNLESSIKDPENPTKDTPKDGSLEFKDVTFQFTDAEYPTLTNINFKTKPGQITAIIGSTGSGKSSIINLIPRFYDVKEGQVLVDGIDVRNFTQKDLRDRIGFVPQQAVLFTGSIKDNILYGKKEATEEEIWEALEVAQAVKFVREKENGLDTMVSQGGKNFSGGQKQRLAIARALVKKPEIYIFDDSFSALDFKTDIKLRTALKDYTKKSSVIIVAQRVSTIIDADQIVVLENGKVVGKGTHKQLLKSCAVYKEIVLSQLDPDEIDKTMLLGQQALASEGGDF